MNKPIPEETIQQILTRTDIVDVVGEYITLKKTGKNFMGLCPFHGEKTPSFSVSSDKQIFYCFGCGKGGNAFTFLMEMEGHTFIEAVRHLAEKVGLSIGHHSASTTFQKKKQKERDAMLRAHQLVAQLYQHMLLKRKEGEAALKYLKDRGFDSATIETFQLGYAPDSWEFVTRFLAKRDFDLSLMVRAGLIGKTEGGDRYFDRFRGRVIFPIRNQRGQVIGFGGRSLNDGQPKYLNSIETPLFNKSKQLFNFDRARHDIRARQTALLFEGYADVLSAFQAGFPHAIATLGTALSDDQARLLRRNCEKVFICYDGDEAGTEAAIKAAEILEAHGCMVKIAELPTGQDPDDYIRTHGGDVFQRRVILPAKSLTAFQLEHLRKGRRLDDGQELSAYLEDALRVISRLTRAVEREYYLRELADQFSIPLDVLKQDQYRLYQQERRKKKSHGRTENNWNRFPKFSMPEKTLAPAYINAERMLLAYMLRDQGVIEQVERFVGSQFNHPLHQRLAAYLYAYYAEGNEADIRSFSGTLDEPDLIQLVGELSTLTLSPKLSTSMLEDYVRQILTYPYLKEIERMEQTKKHAERHGDVAEAAHIAMEIIEMRRKLKNVRKMDIWSLQDILWKEG